jgi:hypothetical protein
MQLIGTGAFSKVYKKDNKTVFIKSNCPVKECIALGWFPSSRLFPTIKCLDFQQYEMKYYERVASLKKSLKPAHYAFYKELRSIYTNARPCTNKYDNLDKWRNEFNKIKCSRKRAIMIEAIEACSNFGSDIAFEISPRNVTVSNGNLILLDCFYSISALKNVRN